MHVRMYVCACVHECVHMHDKVRLSSLGQGSILNIKNRHATLHTYIHPHINNTSVCTVHTDVCIGTHRPILCCTYKINIYCIIREKGFRTHASMMLLFVVSPYISIEFNLCTTSPLVVLPYTSIQSNLFTTSPLVVLLYTSIQSNLFTTSPLVVLSYTSIQSNLFTTSPLVVLPYSSIQSDLFATSPLVIHHYCYPNHVVVTNTINPCVHTYVCQHTNHHRTCCYKEALLTEMLW